MPLESIPPIPLGMPIVDPQTGAATREFAIWWQQLFGNQGTIDGDVEGKADAATQIIAGAGLTGGGNLSQDRTLTADEQAILDAISTTQGAVLYRGASDWAALAPGTSGQFLKTNGAGANPAWASASAGTFSGALVTKSADETTANYSSGGNIPWNAEIYDTASYHSNTTNNSRLTVPEAGYYQISFGLGINALNSSDYVRAFLSLDGVAAGVVPGYALSSTENTFPNATLLSGISAALSLSAGQYMELFFDTEADTSITILAASWFAMRRVG